MWDQIRKSPIEILREFMEEEHAAETRRSGGPYSVHPEAASRRMSTPYGQMLMLPHDVPESSVEKELTDSPTGDAEERSIQNALERLVEAFKIHRYGLHDELVSFEENRDAFANAKSPKFRVIDLRDDVDALTVRKYAVPGQTREEAYTQYVDRIIAQAKKTGRWEILEGKAVDNDLNDDEFASDQKRAIYAVERPRIVAALIEMNPEYRDAPIHKGHAAGHHEEGVVVEFPHRPARIGPKPVPVEAPGKIEKFG